MARLAHPNVVAVYDVGEVGDDLFVAMEYVKGGTLRQWLAASSRSWREVLDAFARAGKGLAAAHAAGIVHRDFKPDNVLAAEDGSVRVADFGLARSERLPEKPLLERGPGAEEPTEASGAGLVAGTPAYMAPEVIEGRPADARSDLFSFGVALYEALHGERPFAGSTMRELHQAITRGEVREAPRGTSVPSWVRRVLLQ